MTPLNDRVAVVGSRTLPEWLEGQIEAIGSQAVRQGNVLVTGGAVGADQAAIRGAQAVNPRKIAIWLPWVSYEEINLAALPRGTKLCADLDTYPQEAKDLVSYWYSRPFELVSQGVRKLMLRNYKVVTSASYVTAFPRVSEGRPVGGTAFAIWLAHYFKKELRVTDVALSYKLRNSEWDLCPRCHVHRLLWDCGSNFHSLKSYS